MSKTVFADGNPSLGEPGTIVAAGFLNALNNHRHTGRDIDGEGAIDYAVATGANNAYVVALTPALDAYVPGMPIIFKANHTNSGASTLAVGALAATSLKKNIDQAMEAGNIVSGKIYVCHYDGTNIQVLNPSPAQAESYVRDAFRSLVIKNNTTTPNSKVDVTADEVVLQDTYKSRTVVSLSCTVDITAAGANGLDTGAEANSTWYYIWAIAKEDGTKAALLSVSATAPTLPSGYTYKALLGAIYNTSAGNFIKMQQFGKVVYRDTSTPLSSGTATSVTSVDISPSVPSTAKIVRGIAFTSGYITIGRINIFPDTSEAILTMVQGMAVNAGSGPGLGGHFEMILASPQMLYYKISGDGTPNGTININGWEY